HSLEPVAQRSFHPSSSRVGTLGERRRCPPLTWDLRSPGLWVRYKPIVIATGVIIALGATSAGVAAAKLMDPQIAHIVVTADDLDIANAKQALQKSQNAEVQRFAHRMIADHGSVTDQAVALAKKLKITPEDNPTSKSLKDAQDANRTKLDALSGAAFDK